MKVRRILHAALVCSLIAISLPVEASKPDLPPEVLSAKTIAIRVKLVGGVVIEKRKKYFGPAPYHFPSIEELNSYRESIYSAVEEVFNRKKRFQVVSDPSQADLVCVVALYEPRFFEGKTNGAELTVVMIVKGGASAQWDAAPLWLRNEFRTYSSVHLDQVAHFHDDLENTKRKSDQ